MRFLRDYWSQFLYGLATLGLAIGSVGFSIREKPLPVWHERWEIWFFAASVIAALAAIIATTKNSQSVTQLKTELGAVKSSLARLQSIEDEIQQKYGDLCSLHLAGLLRRMGLEENDRISIYKHNGTSFWRVARHSSNPDHARPGRSIYPDNQGCMGEAFRQGFSCDESLPANREGYVSRLSDRWNIPKEAIDQLTMRARSIAAFALARPISGKRFAIIVFESVAPARIDGPCRDRFSPEEQAAIIQWLETMERFEPKPNDAKQEGF